MDREQEERLIRLICVYGERRRVETKGQRSCTICMYTHVCSQARYKKHTCFTFMSGASSDLQTVQCETRMALSRAHTSAAEIRLIFFIRIHPLLS